MNESTNYADVIAIHRKMKEIIEKGQGETATKDLHYAIQHWASSAGETSPELLAKLESKCTGISTLVEAIEAKENPTERARLKIAVQRFCRVALDEIESEEVSKLGGYFFSLASGPDPSPDLAHQATLPPAAGERLHDLDVKKLYDMMLQEETLPSLEEVTELIYRGMEVFRQEPNVVLVPAPCTVVGDIHGQFQDLKQSIMTLGGEIGSVPYLFLGDYVDRGDASIIVMCVIIAAKLLYPDQIFVIRGNHESRQTNAIYGFLLECRTKYPEVNKEMAFVDHPLWTLFNEFFDTLPLGAIIANKIFCVHGGLSPTAETVDAIIAAKRFADIDGGMMADLTWSDPTQGLGFHFNARGSGHLFGADITDKFVEKNELKFICRAHQCVRDGYQWDHNNQLLTLFSAPNYCGQGNDGCIMKLDAQLEATFLKYKAVATEDDAGNNARAQMIGLPMYFSS